LFCFDFWILGLSSWIGDFGGEARGGKLQVVEGKGGLSLPFWSFYYIFMMIGSRFWYWNYRNWVIIKSCEFPKW
jgi:hypothetical protein